MISLIDRIVSEVRSALSHGLPLSALALALTLPDSCGKAEYPDETNGMRYKKWCRQYVITDRSDSPYSCDMPYLNEDIIYSLRNSLLHQSTPNVEQSKIHEPRCKVDKFELVMSERDCATGDLSMVAYGKDMHIVRRELTVYVSHLCHILCSAAEQYYKDHKDKFGFIQYSLVDDRNDKFMPINLNKQKKGNTQ